MKKLYKKIIVAASVLMGYSSIAQVSAYSFMQTTETYNAITGGTLIATTTANTSAGSVDDAVFNIPSGSFPFSFMFNNIAYTGCNISSNGFITFGTTAPGTTQYTPISTTSGYAGAISAFGGDINAPHAIGTPTVSGELRIEVIGSAPNRTVVIQYANWRPDYSVSTTDAAVLSFQIRLEETTNVISVAYGPNLYLIGSASFSDTRQIGLRGATNSDYNNRTNAVGVLFTSSAAGGANNALQNFNTVTTPPGMPSNGLIYKWTPPAVCTGAPASNTAIANTTLVCSGGSANLSLATTYTISGYTYQWFSAPAVSGPYTSIPNATLSAYAATNITANTFYQAVVTCTNGPASTTTTPVAVNVAGTTISNVPYFEGFEGITYNNQMPNCSWLVTNPTICQTYSVTPPPTVYNRVPHSGSAFAAFRWSTNAAGDYFFTNGINLSAGTTYSASTFYINDGTAGFTEFALLYGTSQSATGLVNIANIAAPITNTTYSLLAGTFTVPTTGVYYIAVKGTAPTTSPWYLTWDDLSVIALPGCSTASGGTLVSASATLCANQTTSLATTGATSGTGISYQWMVSPTSGGPYTNVTGGIGATTTSYTSAPLTAGTYYYVLQTTCSSATLTGISNEATVTVNAVPTASASSNGPLCSGQTINLTAGTDIGTNFVWTGPNAYSSNTQNPSIANAAANANGVYSLIVSTSNCTATAATVSVVVNATPAAVTVTPLSANICAGDSQTLTAAGGNIPVTLSFGTQANQNNTTGATAYPAPYTAYYGGQKMQILVLASELTAAGFMANSPLTSIQFPVVSKGSNWGSTINHNQNFQVNIGMTAATNLTAFQTGLTNVIAPMNFTPTVGYNNIHTFSTPFIWDGTSNVVVETTWSNNFSGGGADGVVSYNSPTPSFTSTIVYRVDSQNAATVAGATTITYNYTARPDFKFNGEAPGVFSWSPAASLSSPTGATVVATPASSTIYTASVANGSCSANANVSVSVTPVPSVSIAATSTVICTGSSVTLTANGASTYSWNTTSTNTVITDSPSANTSYTVTGFNGTCTNTAVQSVSVNALPTVSLSTTPSAGTVCINSSTIALNGTPAGGTYTGTNVSGTIFTPATTGTFNPVYAYTDPVTNCSNTASVTLVVSTCTGLDNITTSALAGLLIYPNPNTGEFTIELNNGSVKDIQVMDLTGRIVLSRLSDNRKVDLDIKNLANGVYYVRIQSNNTVEVIKIVKQ